MKTGNIDISHLEIHLLAGEYGFDLRQITNKGKRDLDANQSVAMKTRNNQSIRPKAVV